MDDYKAMEDRVESYNQAWERLRSGDVTGGAEAKEPRRHPYLGHVICEEEWQEIQRKLASLEHPEASAGTKKETARSASYLTLPTDSKERKEYPLYRGCLRYFPAALAGVAKTSKIGNDKHNPGQELHHARGKSTDHGDCIIRHLMDTTELLTAYERGRLDVTRDTVLNEVNQMVWRALAYSQELHELFGYPQAPAARVEVNERNK